MVRPASRSTMPSTAASTMKAAFRMLLAAMMRERRLGSLRCCTSAWSGTMKKPPKAPIRTRSASTRQWRRLWRKASGPTGAPAGAMPRVAKKRSSAKSERPVEPQVRGRRRRGRHPAAREPAGPRQGEHGDRYGRLAAELHQRAAQDGAEQNGGERPHLHERVAADQLVGAEVLRQDAVLDRPEDRRVRTHQEDDGEQERHAVQTEARGAEQHDPDLEQLHEPDD